MIKYTYTYVCDICKQEGETQKGQGGIEIPRPHKRVSFTQFDYYHLCSKCSYEVRKLLGSLVKKDE